MATPPGHVHSLGAAAVICTFLIIAPFTTTAIGVNYGTKGDNLPPPATVAAFLANLTRIDRVKLFDTNPDIVRAFAGTGISVMVTAGNGDIPTLTTKDDAAAWVTANIAPYYPATEISLVAVGNEIINTADNNLISNLVPAMRTLKAALVTAGYRRIHVSTPHSLGILTDSQPPSASRFLKVLDLTVFVPMLEFHRKTKSPFIVNAYPYFGYNGDTLPYALARPNSGMLDAGTGITYTSMFEAQLDSVYSAMKKLGFEDVDITVGETGWPTKAMDGQIGVSPADAAEYNRYLINEASSGSGTPLMPKRTFETYIFALFNENLKPGPVAERNFGLFQPDFTPMYDVGLMKDAVNTSPAPAPSAPAPETTTVHDSMAAPPKPAAKGASCATAAGPAPSEDKAPHMVAAEDEGSSSAPSPATSESDSTDEKTPEEGGDAPTSATSEHADGGSSEATSKGGDAEGSNEEDSKAAPAPTGAASEATNLVFPMSSAMVAVALSLAIHGQLILTPF